MGYTTEFYGNFYLSKDATAEQVNELNTFSSQRHKENETPGIWCQWELTDDGKYLIWDGNEKFYNYIEWLEYLIDRFFNKWDIMLNGQVKWRGEGHTDFGRINIEDNKVTVQEGNIPQPQQQTTMKITIERVYDPVNDERYFAIKVDNPSFIKHIVYKLNEPAESTYNEATNYNAALLIAERIEEAGSPLPITKTLFTKEIPNP